MSAVADLSVLMPTYNHARYLPRALDAILTQSVQPKEIVVVDDCSTDETPKILEHYAARHPNLRTFRNERNEGVNRTVRRHFGLLTGKYFFGYASDDFVLPGFIEKSMDLLERHPDAGLCCCYHSTFDGITGEIRLNPSQWCAQPRFFAPAEVERLMGRGGIAGHTSILKRDAVAAAGIYLPELEWHSDLFLNQVVAFRHGLCHVPEMLALLTVMPGTYSASPQRQQRQASVFNALFDHLKSKEFADVAASFRRSGCLSTSGPLLFQAAASRADVWSKELLGLLNGFEFTQYDELKEDPDPTVRELATLFLGPPGLGVKQHFIRALEDRDAQLQQRDGYIGQLEAKCNEQHRILMQLCERIGGLESTIERANHRIAWMESTRAWRFRSLLARCKQSIFGWLKPRHRV